MKKLIAAGSLLALSLAYARLLRPRILNWGSTWQEEHAAMPGDDVLPAVSLQTTRVVSVNAPPEAIWPWLVQMGPKPRAGVYTYDWIERLLGIDIENANRVLPDFQHMDVGEFFKLDSKGTGLRVLAVEEQSHLVLQWEPTGSTWAFVLLPQRDGTTRLASRNRIRGSGIAFWLSMVLAMEAGSLVMERKMLLGIKERAERLAISGMPAADRVPS